MEDVKTGNMLQKGMEEVAEGARKRSIVHGVFDDIESVAQVLKGFTKDYLGLCVVVSGCLWDDDHGLDTPGVAYLCRLSDEEQSDDGTLEDSRMDSG